MNNALIVLIAMLGASCLLFAIGVVVRAQGIGSINDLDVKRVKNPHGLVGFVSNTLFVYATALVVFGFLFYAFISSQKVNLINPLSTALLAATGALVLVLTRGLRRYQDKPFPKYDDHQR